MSFSKIKTAFEDAQMPLDCVEAVLITHEHSDHIKGLEIFSKHTDVPVFASQKTAQKLISSCPSVEKNVHILEKEKVYTLKHTEFSAFSVYHDAVDTVGYRVKTADSRCVVYSTDVGHIDDCVISNIQNADLNIIEANYDDGMLMCNVSYPFLLRQRISGPNGHLSNADCAKTVAKLTHLGGKRFLLAHLSEQNNTPEIAFQAVKLALEQDGFEINSDYELYVAPRFEMSRMLIF